MRLRSVFTGRAAIAFAILWSLAACQGAPAPPLMSPLDDGAGYGYGERQLSERRYEVFYLAPTVRTWVDRKQREGDIERARGLAHDLALWRAAELAMEDEFDAFTVEDRRSDVDVEIIEERPDFFDAGFHHHRLYGFHGYYDYAPGYRSAWLRARATLAVVFQAEATDDSFDAAATVARLRNKHPDAIGARR